MYDRQQVLEFFRDPQTMEMLNDSIDQHRKGKGLLTILDKQGKPLAGVQVKLTHRKHLCKFGANLFMLD